MAVAARLVDLDTIEEKDLLELRLCDLPLKIENTWLAELVRNLYSELEARELSIRPPCYLGDEWFSPEGVPAIALPFYLAHPRLIALERKMIGEAEGEEKEEAMRLLRHECGHALVHAFALTRKRSWREIFGHPIKPFSDYYRYQPYSKSYVRNLKDFYAQSHPEEDFAETFAVWLNPAINWREEYKDWPAIKKLEYIDALQPTVRAKIVQVSKADLFWHINSLKKKLESHYRAKRKLYIEHEAKFFDDDLKELFPAPTGKARLAAARFLAGQTLDLERTVSHWTGEKKVLIGALLRRLKKRCHALKLEVNAHGTDAALVEFTAYLTSLVLNHRYTNRYKPGKE